MPGLVPAGMKRLFTLLLLLLALCGAGAPHTGSTIQSILNERAAAMPGAAIAAAVVDNGRVTTYFAGSTGTARKLDAHTLFEVGSVSKTFTATALAALARSGVVHLTDSVSRYLPTSVRIPSRDGKPITLLSLATQHSGLPRLPTNMPSVASDDPYAPYTVRDLYAFLDSYKLPRDPGAKFEYSNLGFGLLGLALTRAAHEASYGALVRQLVFTPLQMHESEAALSLMTDPRMALGHDIDGEPVHTWDFTDAMAGAGAIRSDIHDMVDYLQCNLGHGPIAKTCLYAQRPRSRFTGHRIGLAWWTSDRYGFVEHGGDTAGYHAMVMMNAAHTKGVVVLSSGPVITDIAAHLLDPALPIAARGAAVKLTYAQLADYVGTYRDPAAGFTYTVTRKDGKLYARITGQPAAAIYPARWPDHFYYKAEPAYVEFVRQNGSVVGLILTQDGQRISVYRIANDGKPMATALKPWYPPVVTLDPQTLQQYVGTYSMQGVTFAVTMKDGKLYAQLGNQPAFSIYPSAKDEFYYKVVDAQITFTRASGAVTGLVLHQAGRDMPALRT